MNHNIKEELSKKLTYISENATEYVFRCPYCGDSASNPKKGHLYVSKDNPVFKCMRCGASGHYAKLFDDMKLDVTKIQMPNGTKPAPPKLSRKVDFSFKLDTEAKEYLSSRLGKVRIDPKVCRILSVNDLQNIYEESPLYRPGMIYPQYAVPFTCWNGHKIVCRCFGPDEQKFHRYFNYSLDKGKDCYVLDNKRTPQGFRKHKTIVLAEGIFDVLNTYYNIDIAPRDAVYCAGLNSTLTTAFDIAKYISGCFSPNLIVLADNDMPDDKYVREIVGRKTSITIYRNKLGKDFGEREVEPLVSYRKDY